MASGKRFPEAPSYFQNIIDMKGYLYYINYIINTLLYNKERERNYMSMYKEGYDYYLEKCALFGLEPVNFRYYVIQLSEEQLTAFNEQARTMKGRN